MLSCAEYVHKLLLLLLLLLPNQLNKKSDFLYIKNITQLELCLQFANILGILSSLFLRFGCNICMKIFFYLPVNSEKPKFVAVLVFVSCTIAPFIAQISSRKCVETRRHLGSCGKTVNSQGYSELRAIRSKRAKIAIHWFGKSTNHW